MDYITVQAAVERGILSMAARAILARTIADGFPDVDRMTFTVTRDEPGVVVVEWEAEANGVHVAGGSL